MGWTIADEREEKVRSSLFVSGLEKVYNRMTLGSTNLKLKFIFRMPVLMGIQKRAESLARLYMCSKSLNLFAAVLIGPSSDVSAGHRKVYISCASIIFLQGT